MDKSLKKYLLKEILFSLFVLSIATLLCRILSIFKVDDANLIMIYMLGIIVIAAYLKSFVLSFISSIISILLFNFFFTEPYYTLNTIDDKYPLIFAVMLMVGFIISSVMQKLKKQMELIEKVTYEKEAKQVIIEREKTRSDILRSISHDIRTPLTTISNGIQQLKDNPSMEISNKDLILKDLADESDWLIMLVENMLSATKMENKALIIKKQPQIIEEIMSVAVEEANRHKGQHNIIISLPPEILTVNVDIGLILQVLNNLFDNAFKYSVINSNIWFNANKTNEEVVLQIINEGSHISDMDMPHIFEMFYMGENVKDRRKGSGIGLAVCKAIIEAHKGSIIAENLPDNMVSFSFNLKLNGGNING